MRTGIEYGILVAGLVAPYEEIDARIAAGYTRDAWYAIGPDSRALEIAHYRTRKLISLHAEDARATASERDAKRHR